MTRTTSARPLSVTPVLARLADQCCSHSLHVEQYRCTTPGCDLAVAEACGVERRTVVRWKRDGLSIQQADDIAVQLGTHPAELWGPVMWNDALDAHEAHLERFARRTGRSLPVFA